MVKYIMFMGIYLASAVNSVLHSFLSTLPYLFFLCQGIWKLIPGIISFHLCILQSFNIRTQKQYQINRININSYYHLILCKLGSVQGLNIALIISFKSLLIYNLPLLYFSCYLFVEKPSHVFIIILHNLIWLMASLWCSTCSSTHRHSP